ncbi:hypothetical protein CRUP_036774, partial [Coryphaenoides rupestris]
METVSPAMQGGDDNMNAGHLLSLLPDGKLEEQQHLLPREDALLALSSTVEEALTSTSTSTTSTSTSSTSTATSTFVTRVRPAPKRAGGRGRRGRGRRGGAAASNSASSSTSADNSANRYQSGGSLPTGTGASSTAVAAAPPLKKHKSREHKRAYRCSLCSKVFQNSSNLNRHVRSH